MKVPHDAMRRFLEDAKEQRRRVAEAETREAAAALAREAAAVALLGGVGGPNADGTASEQSEMRQARHTSVTAGIATGGIPKLIDRVFDHLARPTISAPWEELARAANELALEDLARSLDRLSRARGTSDEPAWRIAVALAAEGGRRFDGEAVCDGLATGRQTLATRPRVRARGIATALAIIEAGWLLVDSDGTSIHLGPSPVNATLAAALAEGDPVEFEAVLARDEALGAIAVLAGIGKG